MSHKKPYDKAFRYGAVELLRTSDALLQRGADAHIVKSLGALLVTVMIRPPQNRSMQRWRKSCFLEFISEPEPKPK